MFRCLSGLVAVLFGLMQVSSCLGQDRKPDRDRRSELADRLRALPAALLDAPRTDDEIVNAVFLATLMRLPTTQSDSFKKQLQRATNRKQACEDMIWACVNTREFMTLHGLTMAEVAELSDRLAKRK